MKMAKEYFVDFELEDHITVDKSDLRSHTNCESTELIISDLMTDDEIVVINEGEESPVLESIPTEAREEKMIKKITISDRSKAAESSKSRKYQGERSCMTYVRDGFYQKHISGK